VAPDPRPSNDSVWNELERGFFAAAPPDVAEPPAEPMRFDDLDPIAPVPPLWRARLSRAWAATSGARRMLRTVTPVLATVARISHRLGEEQAARLSDVLRNISRDRRLAAVAAATLFVVTSVSAGVVASWGGARKPSGGAVAEVAAGARPMVSEAAPRAAPPAATLEDEPSPSTETMGPEPFPPSHRQGGKRAKASPRHGAHAKPAGNARARSGAAPASGR
jgi:hypothetical protein